MAISKPNNYSTLIPRNGFTVNYMQGTINSQSTQSASDSLYPFRIPAKCLVVRGSIKGQQPSSGVSGQTIIKLGTNVTDNLFGTFTISGSVQLSTTFEGVITVSTSDDHLPYQNDVIATINSAPASATI